MTVIKIKPTFKIENIVASADLDLELDLYSLAYELADYIEYEPEQFPGAIMKLDKPKASLLLFKNGKIICTGSKSEDQVAKAIARTLILLKPYATPKKKRRGRVKFNVENIVASAAFGVELDLYTIAYKVSDVEYEPEQFPGAILKFREPKASLLLFKNGKIICTGTKSEEQVKKTLAKAARLLAPYASKLPEKKA